MYTDDAAEDDRQWDIVKRGLYELRREYIRAGLKDSLLVLDALPTVYDYIPLDTATMRRAADLWAHVRSQGKPTADLRELAVVRPPCLSARLQSSRMLDRRQRRPPPLHGHRQDLWVSSVVRPLTRVVNRDVMGRAFSV